MSRAYRILSIDGGGIRGLIPAMVLAELERVAQQPISELFDLLVGTSTGGIIALGLALRKADGTPSLCAQDLADLYLHERNRIFHRDVWDALRNPGGLWDERYDAAGLEQLLKEAFGEARLRDLHPEVLVTAYDLAQRDAFFFRTRKARLDDRYDVPAWVAARATSAAPTYFEPVRIPFGTSDEDVLVDGGVFANNPAMCAYAEAQQLIRDGRLEAEEIILVSLGTGRHVRPISFETCKDWGLAHWARPLLDVMFDGQSDTADYQLRQILPPREDGSARYHRLQINLEPELDEMDNVSPSAMEGLQRAGRRLIAANALVIRDLAARLPLPVKP